MIGQINKRFLIFAITQLAILCVSFISFHKFSVLIYINISFYISAALLLTSLLLYTVHSGFFDVISRSFSFHFSRGHNKRKFDEIPALSELVTINQKPILFHGLLNGLFMIIALFLYYFLLT